MLSEPGIGHVKATCGELQEALQWQKAVAMEEREALLKELADLSAETSQVSEK